MSGSIHSGDVRFYHTFIHIFRKCQYIWRTLQGFQRRQRTDHSCMKKKTYVHMYVYMYTYIYTFMYANEKYRAAFTEEIKASRFEKRPSYIRCAIILAIFIALDLHALKEGIRGTGSQVKGHILQCSYILPYSTAIQV